MSSNKAMLWCLLLLIGVLIHDVECRPDPDEPQRRRNKDDYVMFVFGDSFADAGNRPPTTDNTKGSRQWFYPYGSSDAAHGNRATGRSSDALVQSDFFARMVGLDESPPAYRLRRPNEVDPSGVNFAMAGSSVAEGSQQGGAPSLGSQMDQLRRLVKHGIVDEEDLKDSVALLAFSGLHDYSGLSVAATNDEIMDFAEQLTDKIVDGVKQLQDLGVTKVVVNSMPPIGCQPYRTWMMNYEQCDVRVNSISSMHNAALKRKMDELEDDDGVLVLDIHSTFMDLVQSTATYKPCCDGTSKPEGYCGEEDADGTAQYTLCSNPEDFFYWDYVHPTQAGWEAVMDRLRQPIMDFLEIY